MDHIWKTRILGVLVLGAGTLALTFAPTLAMAQANPFGTGGAEESSDADAALNAEAFTGQAQEAAAAAQTRQDNPFGAPPPPPASAPQAFTNPYATADNEEAAQAPPPPPPAQLITIRAGERVSSHLQFGASPPQLLKDAELKTVPYSLGQLKETYYDDGTHGDVKADDNIWSLVKDRNDVMSPEEFMFMNIALSALGYGDGLNPREFFRLPIATTDPLSNLPKMQALEGNRDEKLSGWNERVLAPFRQDKDDLSSKFWSVFVPSPPTAPNTALPPGFIPVASLPDGAEPNRPQAPPVGGGAGTSRARSDGAQSSYEGRAEDSGVPLDGVSPNAKSSYGFQQQVKKRIINLLNLPEN